MLELANFMIEIFLEMVSLWIILVFLLLCVCIKYILPVFILAKVSATLHSSGG